MWSVPGLTISVGKTEISVIFPVFTTHRDRNFGPENCIFEFRIKKYKSQILVKQMKFRTVKTKLLTLSQNGPREVAVKEPASGEREVATWYVTKVGVSSRHRG